MPALPATAAHHVRAAEVMPPMPAAVAMPETAALVALVATWLSSTDLMPRSRDAYARAALGFLRWCTVAGIQRPDAAAILAYRDGLLAPCEATGKPMFAAATVKGRVAIVKAFFAWAAREGYASRNIAASVKPLPGRQGNAHLRDALTPQEIKAMLGTMDAGTEKGRRDRALLFTAAGCGLRADELRRLNVGDIRQVGGRRVLSVAGKGHIVADAAVPLPDAVADALADMLRDRPDATADAPMFCSCGNRNRGRRMSRSQLSAVLTGAMNAAGCKTARKSVHSLRHACAVNALRAGASLQSVQALLRHRRLETTLIYAGEVEAARNAAADLATAALM